MALTITKLKMWKDPGYTRGCLEVPPAGSKKLPTPDYSSATDETLRPHKGSTLTELHLPLSFTECFNMSYLYIEASDGKGSVSLFGWIDSVTQRSTSAEGVTIMWSVDWWRSYSGSVTWGKGTVTKTGNATYKRPGEMRPRFFTASKVMDLKGSGIDDIEWIILKVNQTAVNNMDSITAESVVTSIKTYFWPAGKRIVDDQLTFKGYGVTLEDAYNGKIDEQLGINAENIVGAWMTKICPVLNTAGAVSATDVMIPNIQTHTHADTTYAYSEYSPAGMNGSLTKSIVPIASDDMESYIITNEKGEPVYTLPWGITVSDVTVSLDIGDVGAYHIFRFTRNGSQFYSDYAASEGLMFMAPLISLPINSNAYTSYVLSGQREYDYYSKKMSQEEKLLQGVAGSVGTAVGGAVTGAVIGAPVGGIGGIVGGIAGGLIGLSAGLLTSAVQDDIETQYRDKLQKSDDKRVANQASNILIPSNGCDYLFTGGRCFTLVKLTADNVSMSEYTDGIANNGYAVDVPVSSVSSFITAGGVLQIINLTVTGNAPPAAKQSIKNILQSGVRIVENNPSGVAP